MLASASISGRRSSVAVISDCAGGDGDAKQSAAAAAWGMVRISLPVKVSLSWTKTPWLDWLNSWASRVAWSSPLGSGMPNVIVVASAGATFGTGVATTIGAAFGAAVGLSWASATRSAIAAWAALAACVALLPSIMSWIAWSSGSY